MYLNAQMEKLKTDPITIPHPRLVGELWDRVKKLGVADFLDKTKEDCRKRNSGFSFHRLEKDFNRIGDTHDWDFYQIQYNFLDGKNHIFWESQTSRPGYGSIRLN